MICKFKTISGRHGERIWVPTTTFHHIQDTRFDRDENTRKCHEILRRVEKIRAHLIGMISRAVVHNINVDKAKDFVVCCDRIICQSKQHGTSIIGESLELLPLVRVYFINLRQESITLLKSLGKTPPDISKMTQPVAEIDAICQEILKDLVTQLKVSFQPFLGKRPPDDLQEQQDYFHYFYLKESAIVHLNSCLSRLKRMIKDCDINPDEHKFEKIQITQLETFLKEKLKEFTDFPFVYLDEFDISNPDYKTTGQLFERFAHADERKSSGFYATFYELESYARYLQAILSRYPDPTVKSQRDSVLEFINKVLLDEQEYLITAAEQSTLLKIRENLKAQQQQKKRLLLEEKAKQNEEKRRIWFENHWKTRKTLQDSLCVLTQRLADFNPQTEQEGEAELDQIKTCLASLDIPTHTGKGKNPYADIHSQVACLKVSLKSKVSELERKFGEARREANQFNRKLDRLFAFDPTQRTQLRDKLLPLITTPELRGILNEMYRDTAILGDGGTPAILLLEARLSVNCSPHSHFQKARYLRAQLEDLADSNSTLTEKEQLVVGRLLKDLDAALEEFSQKRHSKIGFKEAVKEVTPTECLALLSRTQAM